MEHTYDLIKIQKLLKSKKLDFVSFNEMHPNLKKSFKTHFPNENDEVKLELWDEFEKSYPKTFLGMYRFWVKKNLNNWRTKQTNLVKKKPR